MKITRRAILTTSLLSGFVLVLISMPTLTTLWNINSPISFVISDNAKAHDRIIVDWKPSLTSPYFSTIPNPYLTFVLGYVPSALYDPNGISYRSVGFNKITNNGIGFILDQTQGASATTFTAQWMALSQDTTAPAYTDTTCPNEATVFSLTRTVGTYSRPLPTGGSVTSTLTHKWTADAQYLQLNKACFFTSAFGTGGTLFSTGLITIISLLAAGDTVTITYQVTASG